MIDKIPLRWKIEATGDFDGGGQADILWREKTTYDTVIWQMSGFTRVAGASVGAPPTVWQVARVADFDGGGQDDILWRNTSTRETVIWKMSGLSIGNGQIIGSPSLDWKIE